MWNQQDPFLLDPTALQLGDPMLTHRHDVPAVLQYVEAVGKALTVDRRPGQPRYLDRPVTAIEADEGVEQRDQAFGLAVVDVPFESVVAVLVEARRIDGKPVPVDDAAVKPIIGKARHIVPEVPEQREHMTGLRPVTRPRPWRITHPQDFHDVNAVSD